MYGLPIFGRPYFFPLRQLKKYIDVDGTIFDHVVYNDEKEDEGEESIEESKLKN